MNEEGPGRTRLPAEQLIQESTRMVARWKQGPAILASGSVLKLSEFQKLGFTHAQATPVPEEVEDEYLERVTNASGEGFLDERTPMYVAREKVAHVIANGAPPDALVCGFDTIPIVTRREGREKFRKYLRKPRSREEARTTITATFSTILANKEEVERQVASDPSPEHLRERIASIIRDGAREAHLMASTGYAVRLPGEGEQIHEGLQTAYLELGAVYALVGKSVEEQQSALAVLTEELLNIMGERLQHVAGGIDYSDPQIAELLQIRNALAAHEFTIEPGIYTGLPTEGFDMFLSKLAEGSVRAGT